MNSRERVLASLRGEEPDRIPYCELGIDRALAQTLMGWGGPKSQARNLEANQYTVEEAKAIASLLELDNLSYLMRAPVYAHKSAGQDGRLFYGEGMIQTEADLAILELPDPYEDSLYAEAEEFIAQKGEHAAWFVTRIGIFPTMLRAKDLITYPTLAGYLRPENVLALARAAQKHGPYPFTRKNSYSWNREGKKYG
jgi:hypothetical protein